MAIQSESFFEAPATNGASRYSNPEANLFGSSNLHWRLRGGRHVWQSGSRRVWYMVKSREEGV